MKPKEWKQFLSNDENKKQLSELLKNGKKMITLLSYTIAMLH